MRSYHASIHWLRLVRPGVLAQARWGLSATGAPRSQVRRLRSLSVQAAGRARPGRDTFIQYNLTFVEENDIVADVIGDLLCDLNRVWQKASKEERDDTR